MPVKSWREYEHRLLLSGGWLPVTAIVLFVRATPTECVDVMLNGVRGKRVIELYGQPLRQRRVSAPNLESLLTSLLPLQTPEARRNLFVSTKNPAWTVMFGAHRRVTYPHSEMRWFSAAGIESVLVSDRPNSWNPETQQGWSGARKLEMLQVLPNGEDVGHSLGVRVSDSNR